MDARPGGLAFDGLEARLEQILAASARHNENLNVVEARVRAVRFRHHAQEVLNIHGVHLLEIPRVVVGRIEAHQPEPLCLLLIHRLLVLRVRRELLVRELELLGDLLGQCALLQPALQLA